MRLHTFGWTCNCPTKSMLSGCCNYTLQRKALDNVSSHSKEVTNTLLRNFYADVVLKSVSSLRSALIRIQKLADLCKRGRFKLIKIISIKKDVMFQIPDGLSSLTGSLTIELKILSTFQYQGC